MEVMSRKSAWCSSWNVENFMFYLSRSRAESEAVMVAVVCCNIGEVAVYRLDELFDAVPGKYLFTALDKKKYLQIGRTWVQKHRRPIRDRSIFR